MSARPVKSFEIVCDWPECDEKFENGDYSIFGPGWDIEEMVYDSEWHQSRSGGLHYCTRHRGVWASDHEGGEPFPEPPYLLIHDADTDDDDDDGKVTLISKAVNP